MDARAILEKSSRALALQYGSILQQTFTSGSSFGFECRPLLDRHQTGAGRRDR
jgi:hypothetical protein